MDKNTTKWPGGASLFDSVPEGWHMRKQAAELVGRSTDTLKRWQREGTYEPSGYTIRGELVIWLWSDEDIEKMKTVAGTMKIGRPRKAMDDEASD